MKTNVYDTKIKLGKTGKAILTEKQLRFLLGWYEDSKEWNEKRKKWYTKSNRRVIKHRIKENLQDKISGTLFGFVALCHRYLDFKDGFGDNIDRVAPCICVDNTFYEVTIKKLDKVPAVNYEEMIEQIVNNFNEGYIIQHKRRMEGRPYEHDYNLSYSNDEIINELFILYEKRIFTNYELDLIVKKVRDKMGWPESDETRVEFGVVHKGKSYGNYAINL